MDINEIEAEKYIDYIEANYMHKRPCSLFQLFYEQWGW